MKALYQTDKMLRALLKRDKFKLIFWILGMVAFAASGAGKMEMAAQPATASSLYTMFVQNPAMKALFGATPITSPAAYTLGPIFGQTMTLITGLVFAIISIIYTVNRSRKEEDEGMIELFRSYSVGKLANTSALVIELLVLHLVMALALGFSLQAQNVSGLNLLSSNLLFAFATSFQGLLWGMLALLFSQIFPDASAAKGASFGLLGLFYILRMGTDVSNFQLGWFNPLAWSYLSFPYVKGHETWNGAVLMLLFSFLILAVAYVLELRRDLGAGYIPQGHGRAQAGRSLLSLPGLVFRLQRNMIIGWLLGILVLGLVYGSMFGQMNQFIKSNPTIRQIFVGQAQAQDAIVGNFMVTLFAILSLMVAAFAIILFSRLVTEERKNRQEQLYALAVSRLKMYLTYLLLALGAACVAQFLALLGVFLEQQANKNSLSFAQVMKPGLIWLVAIVFVLALLSLLIALAPRLTSLIWIYLAFLLFMNYLGKLLDFPKWLEKLSVYDYIPKLPVEKMAWGNVNLILLLSLALFVISAWVYRQRDLISA